MSIKNYRGLIALVLFLAIPFVLLLLQSFPNGPGLVWFSLSQVYYWPMSWLGSPLFTPDSEIGFVVTPAGRVATAVAYAIAGLLLIHVLRRRSVV